MQMIAMAEHYFVLFMIYNFLGWIFEEVVCSIGYRQLVNQGFMRGPYLPIYGCGAMLNLVILGRVEDPLAIFVLSIILSAILEYLTAFFLEKIFHARWWDYSNFRYQLHGRVCLAGALAFGALSIVELKLVNPLLEEYIGILPEHTVQTGAIIMFIVFFADLLSSAYRQYGRKEYFRFPAGDKA